MNHFLGSLYEKAQRNLGLGSSSTPEIGTNKEKLNPLDEELNEISSHEEQDDEAKEEEKEPNVGNEEASEESDDTLGGLNEEDEEEEESLSSDDRVIDESEGVPRDPDDAGEGRLRDFLVRKGFAKKEKEEEDSDDEDSGEEGSGPANEGKKENKIKMASAKGANKHS